MLIIKLIGGLGNQMFQYALGRKLSLQHGVELKLDLSWFDNVPSIDTKRSYALGVYNINENFATKDDIKKYKKIIAPNFPILNMLFDRLTSLLGLNKSYIREKQINFIPEILEIKDNSYLDGYWQCEKYFDDIKDILQKDFTLKEPLSDRAKGYDELIQNCNAVSLHIRRGDYVKNPRTNAFHGICGLDYYEKCIDIIENKVEKPHFFVFSDEPDWAKENLKLSHPAVYLDRQPQNKDAEDMYLFTHCKHHIIANSSFSWWGAWLSQNPGKIVLAPKHWLNLPYEKIKDIVPESWQKID
ncbi:MAG: alpha-1,2-fucosyltransferase [FCB group bacterium]|jgi:hypothetical protein